MVLGVRAKVSISVSLGIGRAFWEVGEAFRCFFDSTIKRRPVNINILPLVL